MGIGCPDPSLLVAYLDGTLFHRDASAIDAHVETCLNCSTLLAQMRRVRDGEDRSKRSRTFVIGGAIAVVLVAGLGTWFVVRRAPETSPPGSRSVRLQPDPPVRLKADTTTEPKPDTTTEPPVRLKADTTTEPPVRLKPDTTSKPPVRLKPDTTTETVRLKPDATTPVPLKADRTTEAPIEGDVVLRGRDRRIVWRTRDRAIEHSTDGGMTWTLEHTADRTIRAGAVVDANVAWLAGDNGLVLRRTKNGWFGTTAPAEGAITAVRASSPSKATVTLDDGRVFRTENGGVTWSAQ